MAPVELIMLSIDNGLGNCDVILEPKVVGFGSSSAVPVELIMASTDIGLRNSEVNLEGEVVEFVCWFISLTFVELIIASTDIGLGNSDLIGERKVVDFGSGSATKPIIDAGIGVGNGYCSEFFVEDDFTLSKIARLVEKYL